MSEQNGIPTPLRNIPEYPEYLEDIVELFWDIIQYKSDYQSFISLLEFEAYMRLFEVKINPFIIQVLLSLDKSYTIQINNEINGRIPTPTTLQE